MRCMAKEDRKMLLLVEKIMVSTSCVLEAIVVETREDSNVEAMGEEIYATVCVGMDIANLLGERRCAKYCPYIL